jgi:hypothetical protein
MFGAGHAVEGPRQRTITLHLFSLLPAICYLFAAILLKIKTAEALAPAVSVRSKFLSGAFLHLGSLRSFGSLYYLKFDRITLLQRPVAIPGDCRIVYEYIGPIFPAYESVSFRIIEPLYCSLHFVSPLDGDSGGGKPRRRHEHELRGVYQTGIASQAYNNDFLIPLCIFMQFQSIQPGRTAKATAKK